jgi:hypothetical protein
MPGTPLCCVTVAGSMKMTKQASQYRLGHPDVDPFDENTADRRMAPHRLPADAYPEEESVPLFLSDYNREPDPSEYLNPLRKKRRASISSLILAAVLAAAASAVLFALISADATRAIVVNVKASIAAVLPAPRRLAFEVSQLPLWRRRVRRSRLPIRARCRTALRGRQLSQSP